MNKQDLEKQAEEWAKDYANKECDGGWIEQCEADHAIDLAEAHLAGAEAARPKWTSVKERLPEEDQEVFVYPPSDRSKTFFWTGMYWEVDGFKHEPERFTHWMPLPDLPKPEVEK